MQKGQPAESLKLEGRTNFDEAFAASSMEIRNRVFNALQNDVKGRMCFTNVCAVLDFNTTCLMHSSLLLELPILTAMVKLVKKLADLLDLRQLYDTTTVIHESVLHKDAILSPLEESLKLLKIPTAGSKRKTQINHVFKFFGCELEAKRKEERIGKGKKISHYNFQIVIKDALVVDTMILLTPML